MRIETNPVQAQAVIAAAAPERRNGGGSRFSLDGSREPVRSSSARASIPLATMGAILALQGEEEQRGERRRRGARRGRDILDALDTLKIGILGGRIAPGDIRRIVHRLRAETGPTGDAGLDRIMAEIELRAEVELAKLAAAGIAI